MEKMKSKENILNNGSPLCSLDPFLDECGIIKVGERIRKSGLNTENVHPINLAKKSEITESFKYDVIWCYLNTARSGRDMTLNGIRCNGFWVICDSSVVKSVIFKCIIVVNSKEELRNR